MNKKTKESLLPSIKNSAVSLPKDLQERLTAKLWEKHEDKIIEMVETRNQYIKKINEIDTEIKKLTSVYGE